MKFKLSKKAKKTKTKAGFTEKIGHDPYVDWPIIFATTLTLTLLLVGVGVLKYLDTGKDSAAPAPTSGISGDAKALTEVIKAFDDKAIEHASLERGYVGPADPSI